MNIWESFLLALSSIWNHKVRSILTMLGIIIGVSSVIIVVAVGEGAKEQMTKDMFNTDDQTIPLYFNSMSFDENGEETWVEMPNITTENIKQLREQVPGIKTVLATNNAYGNIVNNDKKTDLSIKGIDNQYFIAKNLEMMEGRRINTRDNDSFNRVIMIDDLAREKLFKFDEEAVGTVVDIENNPYKVVGVYKSTLPPELRNMQGFDGGEILMPRSLVSMMFGSPDVDEVQLYATSPELVATIGNEAAAAFNRILKLEAGGFESNDMSEYAEEFNKFMTTITLFISAIAGISLFVGGIGVMNIMLVSVTERTREIGLRKALGATRGQISLQFLIESVTLTSLGGLIGITFAFIVTRIIGLLKFNLDTMQLQPSMNWTVVLIAFIFSSLVGVVFGILPANKASKLSPIDALRHE